MKQYYQPEVVAQHIPAEDIPADVVEARFLRPGELIARQQQCPVAYLPLGTMEWHGRHNPLGCDSIKAEQICIQAAKRAGGVVFPALYFGMDSYWDCGNGIGYGMDPVAGFQLPGSFYGIDEELFVKLLQAACRNYLARGFKRVVLVAGHNAQSQGFALNRLVQSFFGPDGQGPVEAFMDYLLITDDQLREASGDHAGAYETSMMMHLCGSRVDLTTNHGQQIPLLAQSSAFPMEQASAENGRLRFESAVDGLCAIIEGYKANGF